MSRKMNIKPQEHYKGRILNYGHYFPLANSFPAHSNDVNALGIHELAC